MMWGMYDHAATMSAEWNVCADPTSLPTSHDTAPRINIVKNMITPKP